MGVASFLLLHLHCDDSVGDSELASHVSALIDGFILSKAPPASRVIPLLNICSIARRLPLPHLAAQGELHLAFALAAARKHVQVEEVHLWRAQLWRPVHPSHACFTDASARRAHSSPLCAHAISTPQCLPTCRAVRVGCCRGAHALQRVAPCSRAATQGLSLHTHALLKLQCFHTAAVLWAAHSSHGLCDTLCERARATEGIGSLRLGLEDALAQAAVSLRIPPITQLCPGNRSVLLGIAPLLWPLIMYALPCGIDCSHVEINSNCSLTLKTGSAPLVQASCAAAEFIVEQCGCSIACVSKVSIALLLLYAPARSYASAPFRVTPSCRTA